MSNIWEVGLQSCTLTFTAVLLLIVKNALRDKLSPRWQYGVWAVLALRALWPVSMSRTLLFNFPLWFEMLKSRYEGGGSAYAEKYVPLDVQSGLPWVEAAPQSFADWLFIVYIAGIFAFLLRRSWSYLRLRLLLRRGEEPSDELAEAIARVCAGYGLRPCRTVEVAGLPTAFVCGVFRPILAVPGGKLPDDKVLLHELLHLKYFDVLQNVLWCLLRALHWWNIFLVPVFERIENELESLCDQRVLERLEGTERREYGSILLNMASEKFARATGTSSISNGGAFISERIENIARFKKYPRGMALVSLCIVFVLGLNFLGGTVKDYDVNYFGRSAYSTNIGNNAARGMAVTRLVRCQTPDAAIDTYAKAMLQRNGYYLATASPLSRQEEISEYVDYANSVSEWKLGGVFLENGPELEWVNYLGTSGYVVSSYEENADGSVDAALQFAVSTLVDSEGREIVYEFERDGETYTQHGGVVMLHLRATETDEGWVVSEYAEREHIPDHELMRINMMHLVPGFEKTYPTPHGSITFRGLVQRSMQPFSTISFFAVPDNKLSLQGEYIDTLLIKMEYDLWDRDVEGWDRENVGAEDWPGGYISCEIVPIWKESDEPEFMYDRAGGDFSKTRENYSYYSTDGASFTREYDYYPTPYEVELSEAPWGYAVRLCWDEEIVEELVIPLEEVLGCE